MLPALFNGLMEAPLALVPSGCVRNMDAPYPWLVHDQAVGGTRTFIRIAEPHLSLYLIAFHVIGLITFLVIRLAVRVRKNPTP